MYNTLIRNIIRFVGLVLLQLLIFDNIHFGSYIHIFVYVFFMMVLPFDTPKVRLLINGFLIGMVIDIFNGTPGLNAFATVLLAYVRPYIIGLTTRKSDVEGKNAPTINEMGLQWFVIYGLLLMVLHNLVYFTLEAFSFRLFGIALLQTLISSPISMVIIVIINMFKPIKK